MCYQMRSPFGGTVSCPSFLRGLGTLQLPHTAPTATHSTLIKSPYNFYHPRADCCPSKDARLPSASVPGRVGDRGTEYSNWSRRALHQSSGRSGFEYRWSMLPPEATLTSSTSCSGPELMGALVGGAAATALCLMRPLSVGTRRLKVVKVVSCASKRSALYAATMLGHEGTARKLTRFGADLNFRDRLNWSTVLQEAVRGSHGQLVNDLLLAGANMGVRDRHGSTPLHIAATSGLDGIVSDLVLKAADKDARDARGESPLMLAAQHDQLSAAMTLLAAGPNLNLRRRSSPTRSALDWAAEKDHLPILQAILDHGADVNSRGTTLHVAAKHDQAGAIHALIDAGADIENKCPAGWSPLCLAALTTSPEAILALLQRGANVHTEGFLAPLHCACVQPKPGVQAAVDVLLRWGADETAVDSFGQTSSGRLDLYPAPEAAPGEIENVCLLLARAPADRAWRQRGWLVMLRSRAVGGRCDGKSRGENGTGDREGEGRNVARRENGEGASHAASEKARTGGGGAEKGVLGLSDVVALLLGLATEGVFRTVVEFL